MMTHKHRIQHSSVCHRDLLKHDLVMSSSATNTIPTQTPGPGNSNGPRKRPQKPRKPNYNLIHKDSIPLRIVTLPPLIPHNPINLLYLVYTYFFPPADSCSHPSPLYTATFSTTTSSVHCTDPVTIEGVWTRGFYGKGNLSRSEPTWLIRAKRKLGVLTTGQGLTPEEYTAQRRNERREFKLERAKKEKEQLELIRQKEALMGLDGVDAESLPAILEDDSGELPIDGAYQPSPSPSTQRAVGQSSSNQPVKKAGPQAQAVAVVARPVLPIENIEHLQLTLEEAFFLSYGLGVLKITYEGSNRQISNPELLKLFRMQSYIPAVPKEKLQPDDPFLLNYVVYHHFRSLGWVVRSGVKFAVDYRKLPSSPLNIFSMRTSISMMTTILFESLRLMRVPNLP